MLTNRKTFAVYNQLIELGLKISMSTGKGNNVFHLLAANIKTFVGETKESLHYAQLVIQDLLARDSLTMRLHDNKKGQEPKKQLPNYCGKHEALSFEEILSQFVNSLEFKADNKSSDDKEEEELMVPAHDDSNRCVLF